MERIHQEHVLTDFNMWANEEGTPILVDPMNGAGVLPTRNWSAGTFEGVAGINSEALLNVKVANRACYQCAIGCRQVHDAGGVKGEGPEYETIALCGANCGVGDLEALMRFNQECDEWGLDTISCGAVVALAMDMTEQGIASFGMRFGPADGYLEAPGLIAKREGAGAELALGTRGLAAKYGVPEMAGDEELSYLVRSLSVRHERQLCHFRPRWLSHARTPSPTRSCGIIPDAEVRPSRSSENADNGFMAESAHVQRNPVRLLGG
jgi:aldehyde:ferredoxin oxidoreductase